MDIQPGSRLRARGLTWDVLETLRADMCEKLTLRCTEGDMTGLEWEIFVPPETVEPVAARFDLHHPAPLRSWCLMHRAHLLNEFFDRAPFTPEPGRLRIEPYQLVPLARALDMPRPRLLLADGVGLGKTIQAGLIAIALIARRRAHRILIVSPAGPLARQWDQETKVRFGLNFESIASAADLWDIRRARERGANPFDTVPLCLTTLDFAKQDHILDEIERSSWDLVILDEAHHCFGPGVADAGERTRRRRLAEVLARRSDGLLLLTATPHDGHDAHFASLIELLDPSLVDGRGGFAGRAYRHHVVRRLKAHIRDPRTGAPMFRCRRVQPVKVDTAGQEHEPVRAFHRALTAFVVPRLRRPRGADDALAFVSLLKRSVSTIAACAGTLRVVMERIARREAGEAESKPARAERARSLRRWRRRAARFGTLDAADADGQQAAEAESMAEALRTESGADLSRLLDLAAAAQSADPKLGAIVLEIRLIRAEHARANILIYTEYTDSQAAAAAALRQADGIAGEILTIGGADNADARAQAAERFGAEDSLILIGTDTLAEGLNLHSRCFHLIHLDLPYNPNRLEQRNGRIDRYGQTRDPDIRYLYLPGTFEERLLLHLISKYEKSRAALDVMPDTLAVAARDGMDRDSLTGGLSEDPADLFAPGDGAIQPLGRAVEDMHPDSVTDLIREIDGAFAGFERMAVAHGWYDPGMAARGAAISCDPVPGDTDLASFVAGVIAAETGAPALSGNELRLPRSWTDGLRDMPGFDADKNILRFTRNIDVWRDLDGRAMAFLGRAHPLAARAIRHGCQLPASVAAARSTSLGRLSTYVLEIQCGGKTLYRRTAAILATPDGSAVEASLRSELPRFEQDAACSGLWERLFESWAGLVQAPEQAAIAEISRAESARFMERQKAKQPVEQARMRRWLTAKASQLCGPFVPPTPDLFGATPPGPEWLREPDAENRLILLATDPATASAKRREANAALGVFQAARRGEDDVQTATYRPIGVLMLVPDADG